MLTRDALESLLECADEQLELPVCRSFVNPGSNAPHDVCSQTDYGNGQLWVANLGTSAGWPTIAGNPITCATPFAEEIELGIIRCAESVLEDDGDIPDAAALTADAMRQQDDKMALKTALLCCWGVDGKDMLPPIWEPLEPQGGCVGGKWTVFIRDGGCVCPEES
ncbi:MAG: hypothetical protein LC687_02165 [Actinobacteria bacterium]|nr:hypothetical protein [Actinomycetota bacterium]